MKPLATVLRPDSLDHFIGQDHIVGENSPVRKFIESKNIPSMIFWGPPGVGKTTLAEIISHQAGSAFYKLSAVSEGKNALKEIIVKAYNNKANNIRTILFIDEIHRWSKSQQDSLLPLVENGDLTLIGATTENPSFTVISPLLSRVRVFVFYPHTKESIITALDKAILQFSIDISNDAKEFLSEVSFGDMRFALNSLEIAKNLSNPKQITKQIIETSVQKFLIYDKGGEEHYNLISAVHKSLRSSNPTAATYWVMRMLEAGEDPLYISRRLVRFASEDIGNANPNALLLANVVYDTCNKIGMPECETALIQLVEYLAKAPKNNSAYLAINRAKKDIQRFGNLPVPLHLRNAPTKLMKELDYSKGYEYDHDLGNKKSDQQLLPDELKDRNYFN